MYSNKCGLTRCSSLISEFKDIFLTSYNMKYIKCIYYSHHCHLWCWQTFVEYCFTPVICSIQYIIYRGKFYICIKKKYYLWNQITDCNFVQVKSLIYYLDLIEKNIPTPFIHIIKRCRNICIWQFVFILYMHC